MPQEIESSTGPAGTATACLLRPKPSGPLPTRPRTRYIIRHLSRRHAVTTALKQMEDSKSYALMADWDRAWMTMDPDYEIRQLRLFQKFVQRGLVYRKYKPVYWSPASGTALAEAEIEYDENHISMSAYVAFPVEGDPFKVTDYGETLHAITWTTTPWTLPANRALVIHDDLEYCIIRIKSSFKLYIVSRDCLGPVRTYCFNDAPIEMVAAFKGNDAKALQYRNPLQGRAAPLQPFVHGDFVNAQTGTGVVHCAPAHGFDDYELCTKLGIPVTSTVDENGNLTYDAYPDDPQKLQGENVLKQASEAVLSILDELVLNTRKYKHRYPCDWRTRRPVIIRATEQWFADVESIKGEALTALEKVKFVPESGENRLKSMIESRREWCISRQRAWGVPIPALYRSDGSAVVTEESISQIISTIEQRGIDSWWEDAMDDPNWIAPSLRGQGLRRGMETMDVWFDSGSSWTMLERQADVYLEGSDQHRGWFQSSLLTHIAANDEGVSSAPFKTLITHGFVLDEKGKKMSKSLNNVTFPHEITDGTILPSTIKPKKDKKGNPTKYKGQGPDALRLWVASSEYTTDMKVGVKVIKTVYTALRRYRLIIRMLLGSMHEEARTAPLTVTDQIALHQLEEVMDDVRAAYNNHEFHGVVSALNNWMANDLSAFYVEVSKHRLYCGDGGGVMEPLFLGLMRMLAPITPMLVEEAWDHRPSWMKEDW